MIILIMLLLGLIVWLPGTILFAGIAIAAAVVVWSFKLIKAIVCLLIIVPITKLIWRKI